MEALFRAFWQILLLRAAPQSLPASSTLLGLALVLHFSLGFAHALFSLPITVALPYAAVATLTLIGVVYGLLFLRNLSSRYQQTVTALAGCEALLGILLLPVNLLYGMSGEGAELSTLLVIFSLMAIGWNVALAAHIFRHATGSTPGMGFLYSVVYLIIAVMLGDIVTGTGVSQ